MSATEASGAVSAAVCASDGLVRETLDAAVEGSAFSLAYSLANAPALLQVVGNAAVDLVVLDNELEGMLGVDWIERVREAAPETTVLLVTIDLTDALNERAMRAGAFGVVHKTRMAELNGALGRAHKWLETGVQVDTGERRSGTDRRQRQDWNQVTTERRAGTDRRNADSGPPDSSD